MRELESEKEALLRQDKVSWLDFFTKTRLSRPLGVALGLMICQQLSGINAVIAYSTKIFESVGLKGKYFYKYVLPSLATIILISKFLIKLIFFLTFNRCCRQLAFDCNYHFRRCSSCDDNRLRFDHRKGWSKDSFTVWLYWNVLFVFRFGSVTRL
jgi:hypothetical protein